MQQQNSWRRRRIDKPAAPGAITCLPGTWSSRGWRYYPPCIGRRFSAGGRGTPSSASPSGTGKFRRRSVDDAHLSQGAARADRSDLGTNVDRREGDRFRDPVEPAVQHESVHLASRIAAAASGDPVSALRHAPASEGTGSGAMMQRSILRGSKAEVEGTTASPWNERWSS